MRISDWSSDVCSSDLGYGIPWAYSDQINLGLEAGLFNNRLRGSVDLYYKEDKNQLLGIPSSAQFGYKQSYESGMDVRNTWLDLILSGVILIQQGRLSWTAALHMNLIQNEDRKSTRLTSSH